MKCISFSEQIPVMGKYDVIVAGGGISGVAAALSAARNGLSVLLIEKQTWLGGLATTGLINLWVPLCNGRGKQIIKGMAEELLRLSVKYGFDTMPQEWKNGEPKSPTQNRYVTRYSSGIFAVALTRLLTDEGVTILYDAWVSSPVVNNNTVEGVIIESKSGRLYYEAKYIVDSTGDCDILRAAGVPVKDGTNYHTYIAEGITLEGCKRAAETGNIALAYSHHAGGNIDLYGHNQPKDKPLYVGTSLFTVNDYLLDNQLKLFENEKDKPRLERSIHMLPGMVQFRTTRCLVGDSTLKGEDVYKHSASSIGAICDFDHKDSLYEVPYGTLVKRGFPNLITCGRSASASGWGWDVLRVIPPAVLTGQAAGIACALALKNNLPIYDINVLDLQQKLSDTGVIIHFDDSLVPKDFKAGEYAPPKEHF